jgi:ABC-type Fe3+-hydroxamate transport system substrate-binding protein
VVWCALLVLWACAPQEPRRVISVSESTTRVARALGLGDRLESLDAHAPDAMDRAFASGANLVIGGPDAADVRAAFAARSVPVRMFSPESTDEVFSAYTEIASALGKPKAAAALIQRINDGVAQHKREPRRKVAFAVSRTPLRVVGGDAFVSHLFDLAGVDNVFGDQKGVVLAIKPELFAARHPERVIDLPRSLLGDAWVDPVATTETLLQLVGSD